MTSLERRALDSRPSRLGINLRGVLVRTALSLLVLGIATPRSEAKAQPYCPDNLVTITHRPTSRIVTRRCLTEDPRNPQAFLDLVRQVTGENPGDYHVTSVRRVGPDGSQTFQGSASGRNFLNANFSKTKTP